MLNVTQTGGNSASAYFRCRLICGWYSSENLSQQDGICGTERKINYSSVFIVMKEHVIHVFSDNELLMHRGIRYGMSGFNKHPTLVSTVRLLFITFLTLRKI